MDFDKAAALATAWVDLVCEGEARIVREATSAKPYGWIFFYQSKEFLDHGTPSAQLAGNAPIIVDRNTFELRVTGTAKPLEHYLKEYEETLPPTWLQQTPQPPTW
jgi:immunity protein 35 of polymorphic toxin system